MKKRYRVHAALIGSSVDHNAPNLKSLGPSADNPRCVSSPGSNICDPSGFVAVVVGGAGEEGAHMDSCWNTVFHSPSPNIAASLDHKWGAAFTLSLGRTVVGIYLVVCRRLRCPGGGGGGSSRRRGSSSTYKYTVVDEEETSQPPSPKKGICAQRTTLYLCVVQYRTC